MKKYSWLFVSLAIVAAFSIWPAPLWASAVGAVDSWTSIFSVWESQPLVAKVTEMAEVVLRLIPSSRPLSLCWLVAHTFQALANLMGIWAPMSKLAQSLSNFFTVLSKWLDSWLPQVHVDDVKK